MIIRRQHTANFTTIGNQLVNDERLDADEVGIMLWLLSRPNDWEVRRAVIARRWRYGRERIARVFQNLIRTGWVVAEAQRLADGTFHVIYMVRDDPGPELTAEQARQATSMPRADDDEAEPQSASAGEQPDTGEPATAQPDTGEPATANPSRSYIEGLNTELLKTESPTPGACAREGAHGAPGFEEFWRAGKPEPWMSRHETERLWVRLKPAEQRAAYDALPAYLASAPKRATPETYLRKRLWEGFVGKDKTQSRADIRVRSPQWWRWREYRLSIGESVAFMDRYAESNPTGLWIAPSEWPPRKDGIAPATGPPPQAVDA